jgi:hypothetical protein
MDYRYIKIIRQSLYRKCLKKRLQVNKPNVCLIEDTVCLSDTLLWIHHVLKNSVFWDVALCRSCVN